MVNGAGNVIKLVQLHQVTTPSGIIWVQFDHADIGQKTRHDNRQLYIQDIEPTWTPIKPVTTQFAVTRNRTIQVVRKQFPLRPAAAKTIHRSQGDTENRIVVINLDTKKAIPHIHYVGWFNQMQKAPLQDVFARKNYGQLISCSTTNNDTCINYIYTNLPQSQIDCCILETYFSDMIKQFVH